MSLADKVTTGTTITRYNNFMSLIVKIIILALSSSLTILVQPTEKTILHSHLSFNSTLQVINGISSDLQKLCKYFNGTAIVAFLKIPFGGFSADWAALFPNNLTLYLKNLKLSVLAILLLKLFASSLE